MSPKIDQASIGRRVGVRQNLQHALRVGSITKIAEGGSRAIDWLGAAGQASGRPNSEIGSISFPSWGKSVSLRWRRPRFCCNEITANENSLLGPSCFYCAEYIRYLCAKVCRDWTGMASLHSSRHLPVTCGLENRRMEGNPAMRRCRMRKSNDKGVEWRK